MKRTYTAFQIIIVLMFCAIAVQLYRMQIIEGPHYAEQAKGNEILASKQTLVDRFPSSNPRSVSLKGITEPMEIASVDWR